MRASRQGRPLNRKATSARHCASKACLHPSRQRSGPRHPTVRRGRARERHVARWLLGSWSGVLFVAVRRGAPRHRA
eukprot:353361-Chlamydomonas_euryale.AAC.7